MYPRCLEDCGLTVVRLRLVASGATSRVTALPSTPSFPVTMQILPPWFAAGCFGSFTPGAGLLPALGAFKKKPGGRPAVGPCRWFLALMVPAEMAQLVLALTGWVLLAYLSAALASPAVPFPRRPLISWVRPHGHRAWAAHVILAAGATWLGAAHPLENFLLFFAQSSTVPPGECGKILAATACVQSTGNRSQRFPRNQCSLRSALRVY